MTESVQAPPEASAVITEPVPDLQLQLLIQLLDRELRSSLPITLTLTGGVLHGDVIGHEAWKSDWARSLRQVEGEGANLIAEFPETVDQGIRELVAGEGVAQLPRWIHLRDVTLVLGGAAALHLPLWRGRLADVSGWALGRPQ
ncbi:MULTISPECIES: hypothetical protein [Streptomyces]|uniref:Uncharacterized protein n=1 Tax=Streptomyces clavifer TaxID=68188 RepID=A0ABS4V9U5_9ACTN|nr:MULTISPECIES: hypothetical protein [Streptomyces]KQX90857.1 hypothetical protein ASD26_25860 [Streptomyces sp. Root1319]KQZ12106.1 hypothetical protein ASD51_33880 [Streptomyces sp. Root55]MBP2360704.1 hypothetical protein [Streptomyces clavifer]MDX2748327.1 hypothetical protein [Streptomyces sp. NRRL_B-2557]MDX3065324.1 hypothetical protein [Streptomyces sp. ND04-05B]